MGNTGRRASTSKQEANNVLLGYPRVNPTMSRLQDTVTAKIPIDKSGGKGGVGGNVTDGMG